MACGARELAIPGVAFIAAATACVSIWRCSNSGKLNEATPKSTPAPFNEAGWVPIAEELRAQSRLSTALSAITMVLGSIGVIFAAMIGKWATEDGGEFVAKSNFNWVAAMYELVRTAAVAALVAAAIWGLLNMSRAAIDQATRYRKRLTAGSFLVYMLSNYNTELRTGALKIENVMAVFNTWSSSVESAYTSVRFGSKNNQRLALEVGQQGASVVSGTPLKSSS